MWRVDTQRFSMWKYCAIFGLEAMSPTPTARPATATTRNKTIRNWTSSCHIKLLVAPMCPPKKLLQSSRACRTESTPHESSRPTREALEVLRDLRHAEPHADLQALDRLLDAACERQAEARAIRFLKDDAHVLLRPRHAAALGLRVHGPVLRAAVAQRLGEALGVHAQRPAQAQAFVVHGNTGPEDKVVDHFRDLSRACRPQMEDVRGKRAEDGPAELEGVGVARAVDEELARGRGRFPARERDVEKNEFSPRQASREPRRVSRRHRGTQGDDKTRPGALEHALLAEENFFDFAVETDHDDDELARSRCFA